MTLKILIVDDHVSFRDSLRLMLEKYDELEIIAEAEDGDDAIQKAVKYHPNLIFMDITMPNMNGLDATYHIVNQFPNIVVVIVSMHSDQAYVKKALQVGAKGYLIKRTLIRELDDALQSFIDSKIYISKEVQRPV